jgi:hypothetical protein
MPSTVRYMLRPWGQAVVSGLDKADKENCEAAKL